MKNYFSNEAKDIISKLLNIDHKNAKYRYIKGFINKNTSSKLYDSIKIFNLNKLLNSYLHY